MFIKCPSCAKGYTIPDNVVRDNPRKMRCTKCKHVFTVARQHTLPPPGYEHIQARASQLPVNYTYIRKPEDSRDDSSEESSHDMKVTGDEQPEGNQSPNPEGDVKKETDRVPDADEENTSDTHPDIQEKDASDTHPDIQEKDASDTHPDIDEKDASDTQPDAKLDAFARDPEPPADDTNDSIAAVDEPKERIARTSQIPSFYERAPTEWETETPLDLKEFSTADTISPRSQLVGKIMFGATVCVALFFLFVSFRNGWSLSFNRLGSQIGFAFSGKSFEKTPEELKGLEVTIEDLLILKRKSKKPLLVISGRVFNNTPYPKSHVILRGRVFDKKNKIRAEKKIPCNRTLSEDALQKVNKKTLQKLYGSENASYNCSLGQEGTAKYQLIVNLPTGYTSDYHVEVSPIFAKLSRSRNP